jgi:hypothetical protein
MHVANLNQVFDVISDSYGLNGSSELSAQADSVEVLGEHRRFVVARMGSTGSTWLAKLLNSHPDVLCTHEQILPKVYPRRSVNLDDLLDLVRAIGWNTHHGAYRAAGDVGSVWLGLAMALRGKFTTALLVRHPARLLNTRLKVYPGDQAFTEIEPQSRASIHRIWDIDLERLEVVDRIFVHDLFTFVVQVLAVGKVDYIIRFEDLFRPERCQETLEGLTGVRYESALISRALSSQVNRRTSAKTVPEIVRSFTPQQREWYRLLLRDVAPRFGYDLDSDAAMRASS